MLANVNCFTCKTDHVNEWLNTGDIKLCNELAQNSMHHILVRCRLHVDLKLNTRNCLIASYWLVKSAPERALVKELGLCS